MSIQTTISITRERAEGMWIKHRLEKVATELNQDVKYVDNIDIEDEIEEKFYNYKIVED